MLRRWPFVILSTWWWECERGGGDMARVAVVVGWYSDGGRGHGAGRSRIVYSANKT